MRNYRLFLLAPAAILLALLLTVQMMGALRTAQAAPESMARSLALSAGMVADFEGGVPGTWFQYGDGGAVVNAAVTTVADTDPLALPGQIGANDILSVTANVPTWAGFGAGLAPVQDWSDYDAVSFWFYGENSGTTHEFELQTAQGDDRRVSFVDDSTGWRQLIFPFHTFGAGGAYNLSQVDNWVFVLDGTIGSLKLDNIQLVNLQPFADFEGNVPAGWFQYGDGGAVVNPAVITVADTDSLALPGQVGANDILSVTANVPTWAGFGAALNPVADWSDMQGVSFWFYGGNSATTHEFELQTVQGDDRRVSFVDDFTGWRLLTFPFATFGATPYDVSQVDNWVFVLDGTVGTFYLDHLSVFGDAGNVTQRAQFNPNSYSVAEGNPVTLTVSLNVISSVPVSVDYATVNDSAVASSDFTAVSGTLTIPAGENSGEIVLVTTDDGEVEGPERFFVVLSNPVSVTLASQITATVTIRDNDQPTPADCDQSVIVDNYEFAGALPAGTDNNNNEIGFVTWRAPGASSSITLTVPAMQVPDAAAGNQVLQLNLNLGVGQWGGFTHAFENETVDTWVSQDWSRREGVCFWLYGNNTGSTLFVDIQDNRTPGSTKDDAERWSVNIPDDFSGWQFFKIPFSQFNRKDIGNGAPFDGFGKTEVWGYALGGSNTIANKSYYIDDFMLYGNVEGGEESLRLAFSRAEYTVIEGSSAVMTVSLNMTSTQPVTVTYASLEGQATPGRDYTPVSGTLVFAPGVTARTITVPTLDDDKHEYEERVMVNLYDVDGAEFAFQRRAMLTIVDNDAADPNAQDDFEGSHPFMATTGVALSITELAEGSANALPGQVGYEQVLTVQYNDAAATPNRIYRTFAEARDWSAADGLTFWYFGNNSGKTVSVDLWDNQIVTTEALTSTQWTLRWSDEFTGTAGTRPNPNKWKHEKGDGALNGIPGWGNSEFQYYTDDPANASLDGSGNLRLRLSAVNTDTTNLVCYYGPCRYTSARLITQDRADFQYGRIEARIKLPPTDQSGVWPAFWALGSDIREVGWPQSGEIDIMEYVSRVPNEIFGTIHGPGYSGGASYGDTINIPNLTADFHTYSVEWRPNHIVWYVDGVKYHEARNTDAFLSGKEWVFNHPFFLLLNVAIGGNFGGAISPQLTLPQDTLVDYVRVYRTPLAAEHFEATFVDNFSGWRQISVPFRNFVRSADQPAGAPDDGLTLTSVNGYGFRFPSGEGVAAQATVTTHIDQVKLVTFASELHMPLIFR
ncbi:MAG: family 16 glycosylhydrolase [Caldilineaceae bacterium]|nr:family 16 glycosylhydrolase [Caldilineaceae bacterium]